jgi:hypothetical protein
VSDPTPPVFTLAWLAPDDVKAWLRLQAPEEDEDDDLIRRCNGLAELYVQRCRPDAWQDATDATPRRYVPDAEIYQAAVMYAAREYRRRNSPGGIDSITDAGAVYVSKYDSDIERALRTGTWSEPAVG